MLSEFEKEVLIYWGIWFTLALVALVCSACAVGFAIHKAIAGG